MKYQKLYVTLAAVLILVLFNGCSRIDENLPQDPVLKVHETGIMSSSSPNFHGTALAGVQWDYPSNCMRCHGSDFNGGPEAPACKKCHTETYFHLKDNVYSKAILDNSSPFFHGKLISNIEGFSMTKCQKCHGTNYAGGKVGKTCLTCHSKTNGPEACNTCHGVPSDTTGAPASGLHAAHMNASVISDKISCGQCHTAYTTFTQTGHIDKTPGVELNWGSVAKLSTNNPANNSSFVSHDPTNGIINPAPVYNAAAGTCANTYCHGNFKYGNPGNVVSWTAGTALKCGSCHGDGLDNPLPKKHNPNDSDCGRCHFNVTKSGNTYTFTNKAKHVDGKVSIFGTDYAF